MPNEPVATLKPAAEPLGPRWRRRKEARPGEILSAALDIFLERGYEGARLEDIAKRAGCTKGTIFLYYPGKAELFKATVREAMIPVLKSAEQDFAGHTGSARELLESLLRQRWGIFFHSRWSALPGMILAEGTKFPELTRFFHDEVFARSHALYARILEDGVRKGEFRPMDTQQVARLAMAPIVLGILWRQSFESVVTTPLDTTSFFENALDQFFRGIAATPPGASA